MVKERAIREKANADLSTCHPSILVEAALVLFITLETDIVIATEMSVWT